ncbi:DedA family protein [Nitrogeniibacter mangrovi]|uniref:DedA family protein n=1 Tax=Nitrogeniibacter mangrovi TaxID=2016596 RepID=A0A6C1AYS1_9RHOO|nr:DedA family protein [Nitrogeniibacter mangrovi]QID16487.1 DedA family protein [Nitrogeniibacter mangrovi]
MDFLAWLDPGPGAGLGAVLLVSFLSATLLPGGSELVFAGFLARHPEQLGWAWLLATLGNTAGGMSTYALARLVPRPQAPDKVRWLQRHGAPALILAWAPVIGDALCAAAGWLRLGWLPCMLWMALGKAARYGVVAWLTP